MTTRKYLMCWNIMFLFSLECTMVVYDSTRTPRSTTHGSSILGPRIEERIYAPLPRSLLSLRDLSNDSNLPHHLYLRNSSSSGNKEPNRSAQYDPTALGYEPYWTGGEWVFDIGNRSQGICGMRCISLYERLGVVCAMNKYYIHRTFSNLCEMRKEDCHNRSYTVLQMILFREPAAL